MTMTLHPVADAVPAQDWPAQNHAALELGLAWLRARLAGEADGQEAGGREAWDAARATMREAGRPAAIDVISCLFTLCPFDEDCLLLAAAPWLDPGITGPTSMHAALRLFAPAGEAWRLGFARLAPGAPLRRWRLLALEAGALTTDERMARALCGENEADPAAHSWLTPARPAPCPPRLRHAAAALAASVRESRRAVVLGSAYGARDAVAQAACWQLGLAPVTLHPAHLPDPGPPRQDALALLAREVALGHQAVLLLAAADRQAETAELLRDLAVPLLVLAEQPLADAAVPVHRAPALEPGDRATLWRQALGPSGAGLAECCTTLAVQFPLGPAAIAALGAATPPQADALWAACRDAAGGGLETLAERIVPRFGWDDIVLPPAVAEALRAIAGQVRLRAAVHDQGGFGRKLVRGMGVTALFAGSSGTGKTMAAEVLAGALNLDLCRVDLSGVVSKYIGETERSLKRVFDAAEAGGAVLFFDEADALFGTRSEVKDSHDRYANLEISYLLQRMEGFSGLAILATNLKSNLDPAFLRRLRHVVDFPFPDAFVRRGIWQRAFPAETATEGLDFDALARLDVAGGNIAVIAINAAFLAAAAGEPVRMPHLARAAQAEFRKLDKEFRTPWAEAAP